MNALLQLTEEERGRGVVAFSSGNHAQGVAVAAARLGIKARIFMPMGVALPKLAATRGHGAEVVLHGHNVDEALAEAQRYADETGAVFVHPFDNTDIIAGQGTVGLEVLEQIPNVDTVVMGVGGGEMVRLTDVLSDSVCESDTVSACVFVGPPLSDPW